VTPRESDPDSVPPSDTHPENLPISRNT
jgi:hypothetical protein